MADFKVIETQEDFNAAIADRLERDRKKYAEQFEKDMRDKGWKSAEEVEKLTGELNQQIETLKASATSNKDIIAERDAAIAKGETYRAELEKTRIALKAGLSIEQAGRLRGNNAEEWTEDAKQLAAEFTAFAAGQNAPAPLGNGGDPGAGSTRDQFANWFKTSFEN